MPLFPRLRRNKEQPVGFRVARPFLRAKIRAELRTNTELDGDQRNALEFALSDDDALEAAYQSAAAEFPDPSGRDWSGFFAGLAEFLQVLLPILLSLLKGFGVPV